MNRMLSEREQTDLRHWLGLLMDANEPGAMLACLKRIAELKAFKMLDFDEGGMYRNRPVRVTAAGDRWLRLAEALDRVEREIASRAEGKPTDE